MSVQVGTPAAPRVTFLPLLPLGPDGIRRPPPRRTHLDTQTEDTSLPVGCQSAQRQTTPQSRCQQAERVGFEPTEPCGSRALQARALGQTTQPLHEGLRLYFPHLRRPLYHALFRVQARATPRDYDPPQRGTQSGCHPERVANHCLRWVARSR